MKLPRVAFICVHNSCRSQMAEAIAKLKAGDVFEAYSAGTETKDIINPDAVATIRSLYGVDMSLTQHPKLLNALPSIDIVVTMGCNVQCPYLPCSYREDWGLDDPSGQSAEIFKRTAAVIEAKVMDLKKRIQKGLLNKERSPYYVNMGKE